MLAMSEHTIQFICYTFCFTVAFGQNSLSDNDVYVVLSKRIDSETDQINRRLDQFTLELNRMERRILDQLETMTSRNEDEKDGHAKKDSEEKMTKEIQLTSGILKKAFGMEKMSLRNFREEIESRLSTFEKFSEEINQQLQSEMNDLKNEVKIASANYEKELNSRIASLQNKNDKVEKDLQVEIKNVASKCDDNIRLTEISFYGNIDEFKRALRDSDISLRDLKTTAAMLQHRTSSLSDKTTVNANSITSLQTELSNIKNVPRASFSTMLTKKLNNYKKTTKIAFDKVVHNEGNRYDKTTGVFTAPTNGIYLFIFNVQAIYDSDISDANVRLMVNGVASAYAIAEAHHVGQDANGGGSAVVYMSTGQKAWIETNSHEETYNIYPWRTAFDGALLYPR